MTNWRLAAAAAMSAWCFGAFLAWQISSAPVALANRLSRLRESTVNRNAVSRLPYVVGAVAQAWQRVQRKRLIEEQLPEFLDLLVLASDAGYNLPDSLELAARSAGSAMASEVMAALSEVRSGVPFVAALEHMAKRTGVAAVDRFAKSVAKGLKLGSPMKSVFRAQAYLLRQQHKQRTEAAIATIPMKMTVVAVVFLFPPMLVLVLVPHLLLLFDKW